jgi:hypothetical protein
MIGSFVRLFALVATFGLGCAAVAVSVAVLGLWMLGLVQGAEHQTLQAEVWRHLAHAQ